jgi:hypothetical protein
VAIFPRGNIQPRIHQGGPDLIATFPDDDIQPLKLLTLFRCGNVGSLKNMAEMTREQVEATIENVEMGSPELRQNGFILYKANLELSIRVPGGAEFESRNLTRMDEQGREISVTAFAGRILLKLSGAQITNMPLVLLMENETKHVGCTRASAGMHRLEDHDAVPRIDSPGGNLRPGSGGCRRRIRPGPRERNDFSLSRGSRTEITLHKVHMGNYGSSPIASSEF